MFTRLVDLFIHHDPATIKEEFQNVMKTLMEQKLHERKKQVIAELFEPIDAELEFLDEKINNNVQKMGRIKLIRIRVRKGKIQRRKRLSNVKGYTIRHGRMTRMSAMEKRHRKMGARRGKIKRRIHLRQALRKRRISLRKRHALGL